MSVLASMMREIFLARRKRIDKAVSNAVAVQYRTLDELLLNGRATLFGRRYGLAAVRSAEMFADRVERFDYDGFGEYIGRMYGGEADVTCRGCVGMFARSSGTTSSRSKYIPVTREAMYRNHLRGMADAAAMYLSSCPTSRMLEGRTLTLGGSCRRELNGALVGDLSALIINAVGRWGEVLRAPRTKVALMEDFNAKCDAVCRECAHEHITALAGVPSWNMALLRRLLEYTGKSCVLDVWPDLELFMHGGVSFAPYREAFERIVGGEIAYLESYNASEGFVAIAECAGCDDMLLMPDYGCYYEFAYGDRTVPLEGVCVGREYELLMTSVNGLWRYESGDVVRFTSTNPYRLRVVGRTKEYINAFGEELMIGNAEQALLRACFVTGAVVEEYTVAPEYMSEAGEGCHQWIVEFAQRPDSERRFVEELDGALRELNSDYDAKRRSVMRQIDLTVVGQGTFLSWQIAAGKNKVPRLVNDRSVADGLTTYIIRREVEA